MNKTKLLLATSLFALLGAGWMDQPAHAADLDPGEICEKGIELKVSGQVNRGMLYADNGDGEDDVFFVDNDNSSSRVRWTAKGQIDCHWWVGANFEVEWESNSTADIEFGQTSSKKSDRFKERKIEIYFQGPIGKISLGQGDTASNGTSEVDLSKTAVLAYSAIASYAGGLSFAGTTVKIKDVSSNFDGLSRRDRVRYDTPTFAGFKASTSYTDRDHFDVALRYSQEFGGVKIAAAAAYVKPNDDNDVDYDHQLAGSVSVLFPFGFNITAAAGEREDNGPAETDPEFYYVKLGWIFKWIDLGPTAVAVDYQYAEDIRATGDEFESYGAFIVQHIPHVGTEIYAGVRNHSVELAGGANPEDIWGVMIGSRVKF